MSSSSSVDFSVATVANTPGNIILLGDDANTSGNQVTSATPTIQGSGAVGQTITITSSTNNNSVTTAVNHDNTWSTQVQSIVGESVATTLNIVSSGYNNSDSAGDSFVLTYDV